MGKSKKSKNKGEVIKEEQSTLTDHVGPSITGSSEPPAAVSEWLGRFLNAENLIASVLSL